MRNSIILAIILGSIACPTLAQHSQLDPRSQAEVRRALAPVNAKGHKLMTAADPAANRMVGLVRLDDNADASAIAQDSAYDVTPLRGPFAIVSCAPSAARRLPGIKGVKQCEMNRRSRIQMSAARPLSGIDMAHKGVDLPQAYTGQGVVTGIIDAGFDPNNINFKDSELNSRITYLFDLEISASGQVRSTVYDSDRLAGYITDDNTQTHGTHTMGIMAGSCTATTQVAIANGPDGACSITEMSNPYYGVAPNATIMASTGVNYEALIAYAADAILDYRWNEGYRDCPVVINMSLGGNEGPHDGTSLLGQYLDWAADNDGLISVIAAGNEGDVPIALTHNFSADREEVKTFIRPYVYPDVRYGSIEIYSDSEQDFEAAVILYNNKRGTIARTFPVNNSDGIIQYICSPGYQQESTDIVDDTFAKAYDGYVGIVATRDQNTGRFYAFIDFYAQNTEGNPADPDSSEAQYTLGFVVKGHQGQRIDCYGDGAFTHFDDYGVAGFSTGSRNGSISDMATCKSAIAVGSYNSCDLVGNLAGSAIMADDRLRCGEVTMFSGFGTLPDGRQLPHIVAPGAMVVSSLSTPYIDNPDNAVSLNDLTAQCTAAGSTAYFAPMSGTSMAAPMVAGTIALWLEADPTLTSADCIEILQATATTDQYLELAEDPVQYGAGKLNAYAGLKQVLQRSGIADVSTEPGRVMVSMAGDRCMSVFVPGAAQTRLRLYSVSGMLACESLCPGSEATIDTAHLHSGVYVLVANDQKPIRILIK